MRLEQETESRTLTREALRLAKDSGDAETLVSLHVLSGGTVSRQGRASDGAVLIGIADGLGERLDLMLTGAEAELLGETTTALRQALGDEAFETSVSHGRTMSTEDGVAFALACLD